MNNIPVEDVLPDNDNNLSRNHLQPTLTDETIQ